MTDAEFITWLRFWLSITVSDISDEDLTIILDTVKNQYPTANDCQIKYYFAKATLEHFIRAQAKATSGSAGSGAVSERREKIGKREILEKYDVGASTGEAAGWDKLLESLIADPNSIGCTPFPVTSEDGASGSVIIGVQNDKYTFSSPYRQNLNPYSKKSSPWS